MKTESIYPLIPENVPPYFQRNIKVRRDGWPKMALAIQMLGASGVGLRMELMQLIAARLSISPNSRSMRQAIQRRLPAANLVESATYPFLGKSRITLIRLSETGKRLCRSLGVDPVENEWERLIRLHHGAVHIDHTVALLAFSYQARLRGWDVELVPSVKHSKEPDALITKGDERFYVEVERGHAKWEKWRGQEDLQGFAAICATSPAQRKKLMRECQEIDVPGYATDLENLIRRTKRQNFNLWMNQWKGTER